jgi:hypothetical protein
VALKTIVFIEPTTFGLKVGNCARKQTTAADNTQRNQRKAPLALGPRWTISYPVHGQLHGHFRTTSSSDGNRCQHDDLHHHAGVSVGRARPTNHHLSLNLDTHEDLLSLLQSNFPSGQFGLSQTDDYLARRKQRSTRSIATSVKTMTSIVASPNINPNRRTDLSPDKRRASGGVLAVSLFHFSHRIKAKAALTQSFSSQSFSFLPNNQAKHRDHTGVFALDEARETQNITA